MAWKYIFSYSCELNNQSNKIVSRINYSDAMRQYLHVDRLIAVRSQRNKQRKDDAYVLHVVTAI